MMTGRKKFKKFKPLIISLVWFARLIPKPIRYFFWDCTLKFSQTPFIGIRYILLKSLVKSCGDNVKIGDGVRVIYWERLTIGNNVSIHTNCYIDAYGNIEIGDNVSIAHHSSIISSNHTWKYNEIAIKYNDVALMPIKIANDVWVGAGCRILGGTTLNSRSILAAGAVLTKDIPSNSIFGGIPAKLIKDI